MGFCPNLYGLWVITVWGLWVFAGYGLSQVCPGWVRFTLSGRWSMISVIYVLHIQLPIFFRNLHLCLNHDAWSWQTWWMLLRVGTRHSRIATTSRLRVVPSANPLSPNQLPNLQRVRRISNNASKRNSVFGGRCDNLPSTNHAFHSYYINQERLILPSLVPTTGSSIQMDEKKTSYQRTILSFFWYWLWYKVTTHQPSPVPQMAVTVTSTGNRNVKNLPLDFDGKRPWNFGLLSCFGDCNACKCPESLRR